VTGAELQMLRARSGLLQTELAELLGVRAETLSRVERGKQPFPRSKMTATLITAIRAAAARHGPRLGPKLREMDSLIGKLKFILACW
jgi:DNA-binding XRE family transcriptional regulator